METQETATPQSTVVDDSGFLATPPGDSTPQTEQVESTPPKKRGPGRPRKDGTSGAPAKETPGAAKAAPNKPQKRGEKMSAEKRGILGKQLVGLHVMASHMTGLPELQITPQEGDILADGIAAVAEEYGLSLDGKTGAALSLLGACAMIYAPRFFAVQSRMRAQAAQDAVIVNQ